MKEDEESTNEEEFDDDVLKDDYSNIDENVDDGDGDEMIELKSEWSKSVCFGKN